MSDFGWHFVGKKLRDGRPIPRDGVWLEHDGPIVICKSGLHGSRRPWHAMHHAPGAVLCRVEFGEVVEEHDDKLVARKRRIICRTDITDTLRYFARMRALSVAHLWDPDEVVLKYLMTGDERIKDSAYDAAGTDVWAAAVDAAGADARAAARATARTSSVANAVATAIDAARAASRDAVVAGCWSVWAAYDAAIHKAGLEFDSLIYEQFGIGDKDE